MKYAVIVAGALSVLVLGACEQPSNVAPEAPAAVVLVPVPGPAGRQGEEGKVGATGSTGMVGSPGMTGSPGMMGTAGEKGEQGKTGGDTTVVVVPAK
jgi:Collagen triple helix repeat (20 copies)